MLARKSGARAGETAALCQLGRVVAWLIGLITLVVLPLACGDGDGDGDGTTPDATPPAAVTDLSVAAVTDTSATLTWHAPGDDGTVGRAYAYDIRSSNEMITAGNWSALVPVGNPPAPHVAGSPELFTIHSLSSDSVYYFALNSVDEGGNWSGLSNIASEKTTGGPGSMILVPPGTFTMGSPAGELCRDYYETEHQVTLTRAFYVSTTEVTQEEWQATMGWDESLHDGANHPVETITWFDAVSYCNERSADEGLTAAYTITGATYAGNNIAAATVTWNQNANGYRLLSEAEWEYACRAGSTSAFCNGGISQCDCGSEPNLGLVGWYCGNSSNQTHDVAQKAPNAWGLYDMHGNVWEWCWDWYASYSGPATDPVGPGSGSSRMKRGGSWRYDAEFCRSANRGGNPPNTISSDLGLRLARTAF